MRIVPLYPNSETVFSKAEIYGKQYLVNKRNKSEREEITEQLDQTGIYGPGRIYRQGRNYLFIFRDKLFRIEGIKACYFHSGNSTKNYLLFFGLGDDNYVYFYSFYEVIEEEENQDSYLKKIVYKELGKIPVANFQYFVYFYKKGLHPSDILNRFKGYTMDQVDEHPFFILRAIAQSLKETEEYFYLVTYKDSQEVFSRRTESEKEITTFIKINKNILISYDVIGNDFRVLTSYVWEELELYGDCYEPAGWKRYDGDWILNGTELIHITEFRSYDIKAFMDAFVHVKIIPWVVNEGETLIFFTEAAEFSKHLKKGILWNVKENSIYPENIKLEDGHYAYEPNLFWHWNQGCIPNVTIAKNGETEIFQVWYRRNQHAKFEKIEALERPIVFRNEDENSIFFVKTKEHNLMLVMGYDFELKWMYINVTFFEEINFYKQYPEGLQRNITENGKYFAKRIRDNYILERNSILIVKRKYGDEEVFVIFWNDGRGTLDINYSFKSYQFVKNQEDNWKKRRILKIEIDGSKEGKSQYICISDSYKTVETDEQS